ncbi:MAG: accessory factor UbiK family protein [Pseudohongiellaceae bacterium]
MVDQRFFDELSDRIAAILPRAGEFGEDIRTKLNQALQKSFSEMNVVTREQFQAQEKALKRAEARIAQLELRIAALETGEPAGGSDLET